MPRIPHISLTKYPAEYHRTGIWALRSRDTEWCGIIRHEGVRSHSRSYMWCWKIVTAILHNSETGCKTSVRQHHFNILTTPRSSNMCFTSLPHFQHCRPMYILYFTKLLIIEICFQGTLYYIWHLEVGLFKIFIWPILFISLFFICGQLATVIQWKCFTVGTWV